jgi:transcriptional regulator of met regulon
MKQYKKTVQKIHNTVHTSTHITKIPTHSHTQKLQLAVLKTGTEILCDIFQHTHIDAPDTHDTQ